MFSIKRFFHSAPDPKVSSFTPFAAANQYINPYASRYPKAISIPRQVPVRSPYERLLAMNRIITVSALGKKLHYEAHVIVGDQHGSAGMAKAVDKQSSKAVQKALEKAKGKMKYYPLLDGRTLFHDIDFQYECLKIRLLKKPPGHSIKAQHNIYDVCQALGMQDLSARIMEGTTNPITIAKAIFYALDNLHKTPSSLGKK